MRWNFAQPQTCGWFSVSSGSVSGGTWRRRRGIGKYMNSRASPLTSSRGRTEMVSIWSKISSTLHHGPLSFLESTGGAVNVTHFVQ
ncbi:hypothetical protein L227DRAFT_251207 [Lentinus tigrinus ALCF2SS1-6]|uniref:Uncharacterized protein n=1 Tax=Lentinus tigrinus ALCF2SS1-6 TaxID=1328759 RepID=A0A5C2S083_9APHY|nr:hypothetical protein L227DRAFT_251207 [Lentinus tigrinus ALCF2SS1-6]